MRPPHFLGIDIGGSGAKAGVFATNGALRGLGYVEYSMLSAVPGQAEHDAEVWWQAAVRAIQLAMTETDPREIGGIGVGCTNGLVMVDRAGRPLRHAIMLWDQRSLLEVEHIHERVNQETMTEITGNPVAPGAYSLPTILWLKRHEPALFAEAYKLLVPGGYLVARLTGEFTIDYSRACTTLLFDIQRRRWHRPFFETFAVPPDKLPEARPSERIVGRVTDDAARQTGLAPGTPVVAGCMDTVGASLGSGVTDPGECFVIMGTAARVCTPLSEPHFDTRFMNCVHAVSDRWLAIGALNGVGSSWRWVRDTFGELERAVAEATGQDAYELLTRKASQAPPGSKGLVYLPYIAGERTPIWNPFARGVLLGLTLAHSRSDVLRAVLEGTAFALRQVVEILERQQGVRFPSLRIGGTPAMSDVWNQIIADVVGKPVLRLAQVQTEVLGAAIPAAVGLGIFTDYRDAVLHMVTTGTRFDPDPDAYAAYQQLFPIYCDLSTDVQPYFKRLARLKLPEVWVTRGDSNERPGHPNPISALIETRLHPGASERTGG